MASEIKTITSESLEAAYRALTPSQSGFTQDLMASNTIIPVLDLTASAEGTNVPEYQAQAIAFGSQTAFSIVNTTSTLANTPGFYRLQATSNIWAASGSTLSNYFELSDGLSTKRVFQHTVRGEGGNSGSAIPIDYIFFLASGETLTGGSASTTGYLVGSIRQVADVNGTVVNPSGFTPQ